MKKHGLTPTARITGMASAGVPPRVMGIGPVPSTRKLMERYGLKIGDFDVIELNEAFASQALACLRQLGLSDDAEHVNPNGGAIALGHPLGMSGTRLAHHGGASDDQAGRQARARHACASASGRAFRWRSSGSSGSVDSLCGVAQGRLLMKRHLPGALELDVAAAHQRLVRLDRHGASRSPRKARIARSDRRLDSKAFRRRLSTIAETRSILTCTVLAMRLRTRIGVRTPSAHQIARRGIVAYSSTGRRSAPVARRPWPTMNGSNQAVCYLDDMHLVSGGALINDPCRREEFPRLTKGRP